MTFADFVPLALLAVVFFLLIIRPMRQRQKHFSELKQMQEGLQPGSKVMISSGIHGTVSAIEDDTIRLEIAPNVIISVARAAVAEFEAPEFEAPESEAPEHE